MKYLFVNLCAATGDGQLSVAESMRFELDFEKRLIDVLQDVYTHLEEVRNDGNKVYKLKEASKTMHGPAFKGYASVLGCYFMETEPDAEIFVKVEVTVDVAKTVKPLAVKALRDDPNRPAEATIAGTDDNFKTMTKYTFYESGEKYVKVLLDFPDAKKLLTKDNINCTFENRSFTLLVTGYKGANYKFAVPKLHCRILPPDCSFGFKSNNVVVTLRKKNNNDNWWSLFKAKAVGEKAGDSDGDNDK